MLFSLPPGTEMFHFPGFPPHALYIQARVTPHDGCRVPPFGHPRIKALSATPRGLSRPDTSFIGSWYQGIHRAPLNTYTQRTTRTTRCSHPLSSSQTPHRTPNPHGNHQPDATTPTMWTPGLDPDQKKPTTHRNPSPRTRIPLWLPLQDPTVCPPTRVAPTGCLRCFHP
jgi:hypothetical protein